MALLRPFLAFIGISSEIEMEEKPMTNSEEIIYAPIEIESADQLHALGATWEDCQVWKFGPEHVRVLLVPANAETREFLVNELNSRHSRNLRNRRCMIPGKWTAQIQCPSENSCLNCPFGREDDERQSRMMSLDSLMEEGFDPASEDITSRRAEASIELDRVLTRLREDDPILLDIAYLKAAGYTSKEISQRLGLTLRTYERLVERIRCLAKYA